MLEPPAPLTAPYALSMSPLDWGIHIAAFVLVIFAARSFVSGKGKAQMGAGFAFVAAVIWSLAIGRHVDGFTWTDGFRIGIGALLLVPVFRVLFSHTGGSATGAVVSVILASVIAGPVVSRYVDAVTSERSPELERMRREVVQLEVQIEQKTTTHTSVASFAATERAKLEDLEVASSAEIESDPVALAILEKYAGYRTELNRLTQELASLRDHKVELESAIAGLEQGGEGSVDGVNEAEEIRARIQRESEREKTVLETYTERAKMLELYDREFGDGAEAD